MTTDFTVTDAITTAHDNANEGMTAFQFACHSVAIFKQESIAPVSMTADHAKRMFTIWQKAATALKKAA